MKSKWYEIVRDCEIRAHREHFFQKMSENEVELWREIPRTCDDCKDPEVEEVQEAFLRYCMIDKDVVPIAICSNFWKGLPCLFLGMTTGRCSLEVRGRGKEG